MVLPENQSSPDQEKQERSLFEYQTVFNRKLPEDKIGADQEILRIREDKEDPLNIPGHKHHAGAVEHLSRLERIRTPDRTQADEEADLERYKLRTKAWQERTRAELDEKERLACEEAGRMEFGQEWPTKKALAQEAFSLLSEEVQGKIEDLDLGNDLDFIKILIQGGEKVTEAIRKAQRRVGR